MTINELNNKLTSKMRKLLKDRKHIESGKLSNSIKFNCKFDGEKLSISLNALDYIKYLDDGKFVSDFIASDDAQNLITQFIVDNISETLTELF